MSAFKEESYAFETIERKQQQIYTDAADCGYPYDTTNPPAEVKAVLAAVKYFQTLDHDYPNEKPMVRARETWTNGVSVTIRIAWEMDEGRECGSEYVVTFNKTPKHPSLIDPNSNAFLSIYSQRYTE